MRQTAESSILNNLIFENPNYNDEFSHHLNDYINKIDYVNNSELNKIKTIINWIYISYNLKNINGLQKNHFFGQYNKYLSGIFNKKIKINDRLDKYIIENNILEYPIKLIQTIETLITSFSSLENLPTYEGEFKKLIFQEENRSILLIFIEDNLLDKLRIQELFKGVLNYINSDSLTRRLTYKKAKKALTEYNEEANICENYFCKKIIQPFSKNLLLIINKHFNESIESKPADIDIKPTEKKYPLHHREDRINIELEIINTGDGPAYDFRLNIKNFSESIEIPKTDYYFGNIERGVFIVEIKIINNQKRNNVFLEGEFIWTDIDDTIKTKTFSVNVEAQRADIDWTQLSKNKPYNLEPVTSQENLIGRIDIINELNSSIQSNNIESYIIYGQKRTGKTSIVRTFETIVNNLKEEQVKVIYIDGGDLAYPNVKHIISNFGIKMCDSIKNLYKTLQFIPTPIFEDALAPIDTFLNQVCQTLPSLKVVFIIDEFDEFTFELYKGKYADSFFQTIRSISSKPNFGFILVGGEKMEIIKKHQGYRLNKFKIISVSYFEKENNYTNFIKLVRKPISKFLDISDEGIDLLHQYTSGNPYFTKLICINLLDMMLARKDSSITKKEVEESIRHTLEIISSNSFQHFWMDGVLQEEDSRKEDIFDDRRKLLLGFADSLREMNSTKEKIVEICEKNYYLKSIITEDLLREFQRREVLIKDGNEIHCKVKLFEKWLIDRGLFEIAISCISMDSILKEKLLNEQDTIGSKDIYDLIQNWGNYRGNRITEDSVRSWLLQFGNNTNQRLAFTILQGIKFYSFSLIREKLCASFDFIKRSLNRLNKVRVIEKGEKTRKDILISYLDEPAKSGAYYAKQFADENGIYYQNVVEKTKILTKINNDTNINAILFIDDFIGTGKSIIECFNELILNEELVKQINVRGIAVFVIAISGFMSGKEAIMKKVIFFKNFEIIICDPLNESDKVFSKDSKFFQSNAEKLKAYDLAMKYGEILEKNHPLGYDDSQSLIVFEQSCPNNNLPILWKEKPKWTPLFKRI